MNSKENENNRSEDQECIHPTEGKVDDNKEKIPPPSWLIDNIAELSKNTRSIYILYIAFMSYCVVTIVGTSDRQMLLDEAVLLPLIGVEVSFTGFFLMAPLVAICVFIYLQLYLQELKKLKSTLYANYRPVESGQLYPWMINLVDHQKGGVVGMLQRAAVNGVLWWMLPSVLFLFAIWYLKMQDVSFGWVILLMPTIGIIVTIYLWHEYHDNSRSFKNRLRNDIVIWYLFIIGMFFQAIILLVFMLTAYGWTPNLGMGFATIDVSYQSLVTEKKYAHFWVDLNSKRLNGANMRSTVLINSDLRNTLLKGADFRSANLQGANLSGANLQGADLTEAILDSSVLVDVSLQEANLRHASLQGADLTGAILDSSALVHVSLQGANLWHASLRGADLMRARIDSSILSSANLQGADLWIANLQGADFRDANLQGAVLSEANLQGADLWSANLQGADLRDATLQGAFLGNTILKEADLMNATLDGVLCAFSIFVPVPCLDFTDNVVNALCEASTLEGLSADKEILDGIKKKCPVLLNGVSK